VLQNNYVKKNNGGLGGSRKSLFEKGPSLKRNFFDYFPKKSRSNIDNSQDESQQEEYYVGSSQEGDEKLCGISNNIEIHSNEMGSISICDWTAPLTCINGLWVQEFSPDFKIATVSYNLDSKYCDIRDLSQLEEDDTIVNGDGHANTRLFITDLLAQKQIIIKDKKEADKFFKLIDSLDSLSFKIGNGLVYNEVYMKDLELIFIGNFKLVFDDIFGDMKGKDDFSCFKKLILDAFYKNPSCKHSFSHLGDNTGDRVGIDYYFFNYIYFINRIPYFIWRNGLKSWHGGLAFLPPKL
jgi:dsDNA-binding SOS-regulon protein